LAILESCAPSHRYLDSVDSNNISQFPLKLVHEFLNFAIIFVVVVVAILPLQLMVRGGAKFIGVSLPHHG
jgi:hypothetical protein